MPNNEGALISEVRLIMRKYGIRKEPPLQSAEKASSLSCSSSPLLGVLSCFFVVACWYGSSSQGTLGCDPVLHMLPPMWRSEVQRMKVRLQFPDSLLGTHV